MTAATSARREAGTSGGEIDILRSFARRIDPSDAGAYNNLGVLYFRKGLVDEAIVSFSRALALDERMRVARRNLEIVYGETRAGDGQLEELAERLSVKVDDLEALVQYGIAQKAAGHVEKAQALFERALQLDPDSSVLHYFLAETLYNRGLNDDALRSVRRSIDLNPENPDAHYLLGFVLGDLGRNDDAADANRRAVMLNPTLVRAHANLSLETSRDVSAGSAPAAPAAEPHRAGSRIQLALAFRQKGYYAEALGEYEKALSLGESDAEALQGMVELYLMRRDLASAIATADRFIREFSPTAKAWNGKGVALQLDGRHREAGDCYEKALVLDPGYPFAHCNRGVLLWHDGDTREAINAFRRALLATAPPVEARLNLALALFRKKHTELALEAYRHVLAAAPENPVAWNGIGLILVELEQYADARNAFARAIQSDPKFAEAHYNLSFTLSNLGDFSSALRETKLALALDPMYTPQKLALAIELPHEEVRLTVLPPLVESDDTVETVPDFIFDPAILEALFAAKPTRPEAEGAEGAASYSLARDYINKGLHDRAQAEIARALARGGDRVTGLVLAGDDFHAQGVHGEALERYRKALALEETNAGAREGVTRTLLALGKGSGALPFAESLLAEASGGVTAQLLAAEARAATGDANGARELLSSVRTTHGRNAAAMKRVAELSEKLGDGTAALESYRASLLIDGSQAGVRVSLARLLARQGDDDGAALELESVLAASPNNDDAIVALVGPYRRTGRSRSALPRIVALVRRNVYSFDGLIALGEILMDLARERDALRAFERVLRFDPRHGEAIRYRDRLQRSAG